jgi:hypothetical protein
LEPLKVKEKIRRLVEGGFEELQFIVDFDFTMTRAHKYARTVVIMLIVSRIGSLQIIRIRYVLSLQSPIF